MTNHRALLGARDWGQGLGEGSTLVEGAEPLSFPGDGQGKSRLSSTMFPTNRSATWGHGCDVRMAEGGCRTASDKTPKSWGEGFGSGISLEKKKRFGNSRCSRIMGGDPKTPYI